MTTSHDRRRKSPEPTDTVVKVIQHIQPPAEQRMEGIGFSTCGRLLAVATSDTDQILLYRRATVNTGFDEQPYLTLSGTGVVRYPHDVAFSPDPESRFLAVAQRTNSLLIYRRRRGSDGYDARPVTVISGIESRLDYSDGVAFVPRHAERIAVCNLSQDTISFHATHPNTESGRVDNAPLAVFANEYIREPDGLAFTADGQYLALANHGDDSVAIFRRNEAALALGDPPYLAEPVVVIRDRRMRFPHSVTFSPRGDHLLVSNAGANFVGVFHCNRYGNGKATWSRHANAMIPVTDTDVFERANCTNKMEGGPKGIAMWRDQMAVCSPQVGVKLFAYHDGDAILSEAPVFGLERADRPRHARHWRIVGEQGAELVLEHSRRKHRLRLNASSGAVWKLCGGEVTIGEIADALRAALPAQPCLEDDVFQALDTLHRRGLVEL